MLIELAHAPVHETPPEHQAGKEQIWTVLDGQLEIEVAGERHSLREGATLRIAAAAVRRVSAPVRARALVASPPGCSATPPNGTPRPLPWAM